MDHSVEVILLEKSFHGLCVAEIHLYERDLAAHDLTNSAIVGLIAVGHVVRDDDVVSRLYQLYCDMASDVTCPSGHQNGLLHNPSFNTPKIRIKTQKGDFRRNLLSVRMVRLELTQANAHYPLKVACLPFHHIRSGTAKIEIILIIHKLFFKNVISAALSARPWPCRWSQNSASGRCGA